METPSDFRPEGIHIGMMDGFVTQGDRRTELPMKYFRVQNDGAMRDMLRINTDSHARGIRDSFSNVFEF